LAEFKLKEIEKILEYEFKDSTLIEEAFTHKSSNKPFNNEKLEFVGDSILNFTMAMYLYRKYSDLNEGELSRLRASLVSKKGLLKIAENLRIGKYLLISEAEEKNSGRIKKSLLADSVESIIAAIYLDSKDMNLTQQFIIKQYEAVYPDMSLQTMFCDYKTVLQEITQAKYGTIPEYRVLSTDGPDHEKIFEVGIFIADKMFSSAFGKSKKDAEQQCAKKTIEDYEDTL
jgi:ribonuclease-3